MLITSTQNSQFKWVKGLSQKKNRDKENLMVLEGKRLVMHALQLRHKPLAIFVKSDVSFEVPFGMPSYELTDSLFDQISDTVHSQGVLAVFDRDVVMQQALRPCRNVLVLDQIQDPGNLGTILRTCDALGIYDVYLIKGSVDPYSPKVLRATMGSIFNLRLHNQQLATELIESLKSRGFQIIGTSLQDSVPLSALNQDWPLAICFGNEGNGLSQDVLEACDQKIRIPMSPDAESLNVAVACGIVLYQVSPF